MIFKFKHQGFNVTISYSKGVFLHLSHYKGVV